jgi:hypothetical protein
VCKQIGKDHGDANQRGENDRRKLKPSQQQATPRLRRSMSVLALALI